MPDKYSERFLQQSSISSPKQPGALSTNAKFGNVRLNLDFSFNLNSGGNGRRASNSGSILRPGRKFCRKYFGFGPGTSSPIQRAIASKSSIVCTPGATWCGIQNQCRNSLISLCFLRYSRLESERQTMTNTVPWEV